MAVRRQLPWYWWGSCGVLLLLLVAGAAQWIYNAGRRGASGDAADQEQSLPVLRADVERLEQEVRRLRALADAGESRLQIERAAQHQLASQVRGLETENLRLKDDLAAFEALARMEGGKSAQLAIHRLRVEPDVGKPGVFRYRMLLMMPGATREREFKGQLQLALSLDQQGHDVTMVLPADGDPDMSKYTIHFKHFRRIDGSFRVPDGVRLKGVEVRLLQDGIQRGATHMSL